MHPFRLIGFPFKLFLHFNHFSFCACNVLLQRDVHEGIVRNIHKCKSTSTISRIRCRINDLYKILCLTLLSQELSHENSTDRLTKKSQKEELLTVPPNLARTVEV